VNSTVSDNLLALQRVQYTLTSLYNATSSRILCQALLHILLLAELLLLLLLAELLLPGLHL
jgi:transcriptional regulator of met regulon